MRKLMIATDLSARGDRAFQRAFQIAKDHGAELEIVHVVDDAQPAAAVELQVQNAKAELHKQVAALPNTDDVTHTFSIIEGQDYSDIIRHASETGAELIILGIHRHKMKDLFRGTTVERVIRLCSIPVLVVKDVVKGPYKTGLVPVDLSIHSRAAMRLAGRLLPGGQLELLHATHEPFKAFLGRDTLDQLAEQEQQAFLTLLNSDIDAMKAECGDKAPACRPIMKEGGVRPVIRNQIADTKPDLVILGTHGRTGPAHAILGSVAEDLLSDAPVDVLAVKAH